MKTTRFIGVLLGSAAIGAAAVSAFNAWVDPYLLFGRPLVEGFNALKPAVESREALMKAYQASRVEAPRTIVIGSSRADIALDPAHAAWPAATRPVYNLSLAGSWLGVNLRYLRGMLALHSARKRPDTLVVALDFETFLFRPNAPPPTAAARAANASFDRSDVLVAMAGWHGGAPPWPIVKDWVSGTLTLDALQDSVATVAGNLAGAALDLEPNGRLSEAQLARWTQSDGAGLLFEQKNLATAARLGKSRFVLSDTPDQPLRHQNQLDALAELSRAHGIKVVLLIQPAHASHLGLLDSLGYWADYERFKRVLAAHAHASRQAGLDISLWDFGGFESYAMEPIPANGDRRTRLTWFWDPLHYTSALGAVMVEAITRPDGGPWAGLQLTPDNIEQRLAQVREGRDAYRRAAQQPRPLPAASKLP